MRPANPGSILRQAGVAGLLLLALTAQARAQNSSDPRVASAEIGFRGRYKIGYWTPIRVTVKAGNSAFRGRVAITALDGDGIPVRFAGQGGKPLVVEAGQQASVWCYVKVGRRDSPVTVRLESDQEGFAPVSSAVSTRRPILSTQHWAITLGTSVDASQVQDFLRSPEHERLASDRIRRPNELPDRWIGYDGVDTVLLTTSDLGLVDGLSDEQFAALQQWIQLGGKLLVSAGARAGEIFAEGVDHRLATFAPGKYVETRDRWDVAGLEGFARAGRLVEDRFVQQPFAVFEEPPGRILCYEGGGGLDDRPMIMEAPYGLGMVAFLPVDLDQAPLEAWTGRARLMARLLDAAEDRERDRESQQDQVKHVGYDDLVGQLRGALDQFSGVTLVRFSWVAGVVVLYVLLIGPTDFLGLRRLGKPHWTWISFPVIVLLFGSIAWLLGGAFRGEGVKLNQVDLVDVDVSSSVVRGTTWVHVYSPKAATLDLALRQQDGIVDGIVLRDSILSWQGLPGSGLGGMNSTTSALATNTGYFVSTNRTSSAEMAIRGLPFQASSTKSLVGRWSGETETLDAGRLYRDAHGLLAGTIANPLDFELNECMLLFENWAYRVGKFAPGDRRDMKSLAPLDLKWQLTERKLSQSTDVRSPWDQANIDDLPRIVKILMFHGAAGGRDYTHLSHHYQGFVDLSKHLHAGKAILVGQAAVVPTNMVDSQQSLSDKYDQRLTIYRIMQSVTGERTRRRDAPVTDFRDAPIR